MTVVSDVPEKEHPAVVKYQATAPRGVKVIKQELLDDLASLVSIGLGGRQVVCCMEEDPDSRVITYVTTGPLESGSLCLAVQMAVHDYPCAGS